MLTLNTRNKLLLRNRFNKDYLQYKMFIDEIQNYDTSICDSINYICYSDIIKFNNVPFIDILLDGHVALSNQYLNDLPYIAKDITISFILKYFKPLVDLSYNYIFNEEFKSNYALANEDNLIFSPTNIIYIYMLKDIRNDLVYTYDIYDNNIKCIDKALNLFIDEKSFKKFYI